MSSSIDETGLWYALFCLVLTWFENLLLPNNLLASLDPGRACDETDYFLLSNAVSYSLALSSLFFSVIVIGSMKFWLKFKTTSFEWVVETTPGVRALLFVSIMALFLSVVRPLF